MEGKKGSVKRGGKEGSEIGAFKISLLSKELEMTVFLGGNGSW